MPSKLDWLTDEAIMTEVFDRPQILERIMATFERMGVMKRVPLTEIWKDRPPGTDVVPRG